MPFVITVAFCLALLIATAAWNRRTRKLLDQAENWPTAQAKIQHAEFQEFGGSRNSPSHSYPCFEFCYVVNGEYYFGRFGLGVEGELADNVVSGMKGRELAVSYNPAQPQQFYIADELMDGYEVFQKLSARGNPAPSD